MPDELMDDPAVQGFDLAIVNWQRNGRLGEKLDRLIDETVISLIRRKGAGAVLSRGALVLRQLRARAARMETQRHEGHEGE